MALNRAAAWPSTVIAVSPAMRAVSLLEEDVMVTTIAAHARTVLVIRKHVTFLILKLFLHIQKYETANGQEGVVMNVC